MKNFKKLMMLATLTIIGQESIRAGYQDPAMNNDEMEEKEDLQPRHQGFGRIFTAAENTLTLHPGNAVNALATGDQADTKFGYERNSEGKIKANRANTQRNKQARKKDEAKRKKEAARKQKAAKKQKASKNQTSKRKKSDSQE